MIQFNLFNTTADLHLHLQNGKLYIYKSFNDWENENALENCTLKLMVNGKTILCEVQDGYLQNFKTVVE